MKVVLEKPDGSPYITMSDDRLMVSMQIHDYDWMSEAIKFTFDKRTIPAMIEGLKKLQEQ